MASAQRVEVDVTVAPEFPMTINDVDEVAFGAEVVSDLMGEDRYETVTHPMAGSEDFSYVLQEVPGAFIGLARACPVPIPRPLR